MKLSSFLACAIFLWSCFVGAEHHACYCGSIEIQIHRNSNLTSAKAPIDCIPGVSNYRSNALNGKCYTSFEYISCRNKTIKCEEGVLAKLFLRFNKYDERERRLGQMENTVGSMFMSGSGDYFSIALSCAHNFCDVSMDVPESQLLLERGSYAQFLEHVDFLKGYMGKLSAKPLAKTQHVISRARRSDLSRSQHERKRAQIKASSYDVDCYCGTSTIRIEANLKNPVLLRNENCVKGKDGFDPSSSNGKCYVTYEYVTCKTNDRTCMGNALFVYYNKIDEKTKQLDSKKNITGLFSYADPNFNLTLQCPGKKCVQDWNIDSSQMLGYSVKYGDARAVLNAVKNLLTDKPEFVPPTTLATVPSTYSPPTARFCYCGRLLMNVEHGHNVRNVTSEDCDEGEAGFDRRAKNGRCYATIEVSECLTSKSAKANTSKPKNCETGAIATVYFNKFDKHTETLDQLHDYTGIVNHYIDRYGFNVTLTCRSDYCFPVLSNGMKTIKSDLSAADLNNIEKALVSMLKNIASETQQLPMALKKTTAFNYGLQKSTSPADPTTESEESSNYDIVYGIIGTLVVLLVIVAIVLIVVFVCKPKCCHCKKQEKVSKDRKPVNDEEKKKFLGGEKAGVDAHKGDANATDNKQTPASTTENAAAAKQPDAVGKKTDDPLPLDGYRDPNYICPSDHVHYDDNVLKDLPVHGVVYAASGHVYTNEMIEKAGEEEKPNEEKPENVEITANFPKEFVERNLIGDMDEDEMRSEKSTKEKSKVEKNTTDAKESTQNKSKIEVKVVDQPKQASKIEAKEKAKSEKLDSKLPQDMDKNKTRSRKDPKPEK